MSKQAQYLIIIPDWDLDDLHDYRPQPHWGEPNLVFVKDDELDINKLAKKYNIKGWAPYDADPSDFDAWASKDWKKSIAMILQIRGVEVKPIKYVSEWGISRVPIKE